MTSPRKLTPQEEARLAQVRQQFQARKAIADKLGRIKKRIGVYSGKGGVGKTTVAVNLAVMLAQEGAKVAIFDCDIDCPNVTRVLRITEGPRHEEGIFHPSSRFGVKVMSMSFFQEKEDEAIIWRGPMIHNAINQFLQMTEWGDLDYMVVDLPPGTSDAPLTVMQTLNLDGFVVVSTPQELAALDAKRSINMIKKMNLNVLGIVENMSGGIFGTGAAQDLAEDMGLPFLGKVSMRAEYLNAKQPAVLESDEIADEYSEIAANVRKQVEAAV
jgi:ATP-binding protein involved in chromosome partitioning